MEEDTGKWMSSIFLKEVTREIQGDEGEDERGRFQNLRISLSMKSLLLTFLRCGLQQLLPQAGHFRQPSSHTVSSIVASLDHLLASLLQVTE